MQPLDSGPPATVTSTGVLASVRPSKSPRSERESQRFYEIRRSRTSKSLRGERDPRERDSSRKYAAQQSRSPWSACKQREPRKGPSQSFCQSARSRSIKPNTPQKPIQILGLEGRMPKSGELVLIRMPFENVMGSLSVTTDSGTVSAGKQVKRPNFHLVLISTVKYLESPGKESRVKLTVFIVRSFSHHSDPIQWIDGKCQD